MDKCKNLMLHFRTFYLQMEIELKYETTYSLYMNKAKGQINCTEIQASQSFCITLPRYQVPRL